MEKKICRINKFSFMINKWIRLVEFGFSASGSSERINYFNKLTTLELYYTFNRNRALMME